MTLHQSDNRRTLEIRRHSMREKPGAHLNAQGIALAKLVAGHDKAYDLVVTSNIPRAIETAQAMGCCVDDIQAELGYLPGKVFEQINWPSCIANVAEVALLNKDCQTFAQLQSELWLKIASRIGQGEKALIITHGAFIELGLIATLAPMDYSELGPAFGYCEGIRLYFDKEQISFELLRVPKQYQLLEN
ncbi:hypothetical protein A9R01_18375 ['Osedax' symbiont bacterium Rs2_46_30_T18]|nr:hypothetical protein A9R01_18375 ['Osedax' symbiont bacterium Rs2_46_30_T18]